MRQTPAVMNGVVPGALATTGTCGMVHSPTTARKLWVALFTATGVRIMRTKPPASCVPAGAHPLPQDTQ